MEASFCRRPTEGPVQELASPPRVSARNAYRISGTLVRDVIEYEVGFGWLGAFADSMFVQRQMRSTFGSGSRYFRNFF